MLHWVFVPNFFSEPLKGSQEKFLEQEVNVKFFQGRPRKKKIEKLKQITTFRTLLF